MTNPGCYPTAAVALLRPLTDAGLLPADYQLVIQAVSGYSGHGRAGAEAYEAGRTGQIVLSAVLNNLGKGAAGAAVQNLRLMARA